jgi:hypothetical protein
LRRILPLAVLAVLAGCSDDPMRRIPPTDRALLEAEARLGTGGGQGAATGRMSVEDILARARGEAQGGAGLTLRFADGAVQPDPAQRAQLAAFAARNRGGAILVTGGRGDPAMLGERRAVAVARALEDAAPQVELRFASGTPPDLVQIASTRGTPLANDGGR